MREGDAERLTILRQPAQDAPAAVFGSEHRDWTETYLVHAFLLGNTQWEVMLFTSWLWACHHELVPDGLRVPAPGSLWLRKTA
jgi:hypothetical protein